MSLVPLTAPAVEPVSLAEAKAHLRIDGSDEDTLIAALITTSRLQVEAVIGRALITQSWACFLDRWPAGGTVELPLAPVQSVLTVRTFRADDTPEVVAAGSYQLDGARQPPRIVPRAGGWPPPGRAANGIEIQFTAGYGAAASAVPGPLRHAILLLVAHWYEQREPVAAAADTATRPLPIGLADLLSPFHVVRL